MGAIMRRNEDDDPPVNAVPTFLWPTKTENIPKRVTFGEPVLIFCPHIYGSRWMRDQPDRRISVDNT